MLTYLRPTALPELVEMVAAHGRVDLLAGGTDLHLMRDGDPVRLATPVVDLKWVPELVGIVSRADASVVGAATPLVDVMRHPRLTPSATGDGAGLVGSNQTRARASLGGNIVRASPAGDSLCGTLVDDASFTLVGPSRKRVVPAREFFLGPGRTMLDSGEVFVSIIVPTRPGGSAYHRWTFREALDLATAGVAVRVETDTRGVCTACRVAVGACGPVPMLVPEADEHILGRGVGEVDLGALHDALLERISPIDDVRGTEQFRRFIVGELARQSVDQAFQRATQSEGEL